MFFALEIPSEKASELNQLSPNIMFVHGKIDHARSFWLVDLTSVLNFWRQKARSLNQDHRNDFFRSLLEKIFGEKYRCAAAAHPWQALLLVNLMQERDLFGLVDRHESFGQALFKTISWEHWWSACHMYAAHLEQQKKRGFNPLVFRRQCELMKRSLLRLNCHTPWQLSQLSPYAIRRRFGQTLKDLWMLTFVEKSPDENTSELFPWQGYQFEPNLSLERFLEQNIYEWSYLTEFLKEDYDRFLKLKNFLPNDEIIRLEWRINFEDQTTLSVPVIFRYPHNLHEEKGEHHTALLQTQYSFNHHIAKFYTARFGEKASESIWPLGIISWQIEITEKLRRAPRMIDLFGEHQSKLEDLFKLENALAIPLEAFTLTKDWLPEDSFQTASTNPDWNSDEMACSWAHLAMKRPLFLYRQPQRLKLQHGFSHLWQFLEHTMDKWWIKKNLKMRARDYYRLIDKQNHHLWVFKDSLGRWFTHGIFA